MSTSTGAPRPTSQIITTFETALTESGQSRIERASLWHLWDQADPGWAGTWAARLRLADALTQLAAADTIRLPSIRGRLWDNALPPLPQRIDVPGNRSPAGRALDPATEPWAPLMASWAPMWIRTARPPQRLRLDAVRINRWLLGTTGHPQPVIAREERSLHIFNDEKRLAHLTGGALFAPGRLRLEHLACQPPAGNIGAARLGPHGAVLVVENKSTFDSAWRAQRAADQPTYAAIILGNGDAASTLVADLSQLEELLGVQATTVHYAGDVDIAGIEAAHAFTTAADAAGLEATAATPLWDAVARAEPTGDDLTGHTTSKDSAIDTAKRLKLPSSVISRLEQGVRVPQERVDRTALSRTECGDPRPSQPWFRDRRTSARFDGRSAAELHHLVDQANFACPAKQQPPRLGPASATTAPTRPLRAPRWATAAGRHLPSVAESCAGRMASVGRR